MEKLHLFYKGKYLGVVFIMVGFITTLLPIKFLYLWSIFYIMGLILITIGTNKKTQRILSFFCIMFFGVCWIFNGFIIPTLDFHFLGIGAYLFPYGVKLSALAIISLFYGVIIFTISFLLKSNVSIHPIQ